MAVEGSGIDTGPQFPFLFKILIRSFVVKFFEGPPGDAPTCLLYLQMEIHDLNSSVFIEVSFIHHKFHHFTAYGFVRYSKGCATFTSVEFQDVVFTPKRNPTPISRHTPHFSLPRPLATKSAFCLHGFANSGRFFHIIRVTLHAACVSGSIPWP